MEKYMPNLPLPGPLSDTPREPSRPPSDLFAANTPIRNDRDNRWYCR